MADKPEVSAEETVVHAGVGHQAILVCQVFHHQIGSHVAEGDDDDHYHDGDDGDGDAGVGHQAILVCQVFHPGILVIMLMKVVIMIMNMYFYPGGFILKVVLSFMLQVHASPEAEVTWYRGTLLMESDNRSFFHMMMVVVIMMVMVIMVIMLIMLMVVVVVMTTTTVNRSMMRYSSGCTERWWAAGTA